MSTYHLRELLTPKSMALIGASIRAGSVGAAVLRNLRRAKFQGELRVVNLRYREIEGILTYPSLGDLPFVPELIVVTAPAPVVPSIVAEAAHLGVKGAVIISSGLGHGSKSLAEQVERSARTHGMRLVGPNCLGIINPQAGLNASFASQTPAPGHLALISQSGAIVAAMIEWAAQKSIGFSGILSVGDQLDVDVADALDLFAIDPDTHAILLYIEAIKDARKFMSAARAAARIKPVIVVKSGRMAQGAKATSTHTGALAGADAVYDAAFRRAGLLRVLDLRELFDCAEILNRFPTPVSNRLLLLTNGGGLGVLAVDRLAELGGAPAELSPNERRLLERVLPPTWSRSNPIDIGGDADAARYQAALQVLLEDPSPDAILLLNVQTAIASATETAKAVTKVVSANRDGAKTPRPVMAVWVGADDTISKLFNEAAIPNFPTEDDAVRGFMYLANHSVAKQALSDVPSSLPDQFVPVVDSARHIIKLALAEGREWLDPIEVKQVLDAYLIPIVPTIAAATPDEAAECAKPFFHEGIPVAVKILSRDIVHKSDIGGVMLNLIDATAVRDAARTILERSHRMRPDARTDGVIVQPMITRTKARELIFGVADDPTFGPVIVFGCGGIAVEVVDDKALALPPLDMNLARDLVNRTKVARLLETYRDVPAVKRDEVPLTLMKLAQLVADIPEIKEIDINPILADDLGVLAVDARVSIGEPRRQFSGRGNAHFAVRPYPSQWERRTKLEDGTAIFIRPIRPEDEPALHEMLRCVDKSDLRLRFFSAISEFTHAFVARLTQLDYARSIAFVALDQSRHILGVVRFHSDSLYESGEYAILVRSDHKGKGIGWKLMQLLIEYARSEGLKRISGQVLQGNTVMLGMCRELGFEVKTDPSDPTLAAVDLTLGGGSAC